jgi:hypothetical protein
MPRNISSFDCLMALVAKDRFLFFKQTGYLAFMWFVAEKTLTDCNGAVNVRPGGRIIFVALVAQFRLRRSKCGQCPLFFIKSFVAHVTVPVLPRFVHKPDCFRPFPHLSVLATSKTRFCKAVFGSRFSAQWGDTIKEKSQNLMPLDLIAAQDRHQ